jgi:hypothetical protein
MPEDPPPCDPERRWNFPGRFPYGFVGRRMAAQTHIVGGSMRILWTLFKVMVGLAIAIPVGILLLALTAGVLGTMIAFAVFALRLAIIAFVGYGLFRLARHLFFKPSHPAAPVMRDLPPVDPYYQAAVRELDAELGTRN